jgi:hypothetical protein
MYFILHWLPDWFTLWAIYIACALGVGLYVFSKLISWIPGFNQYKLLAEILGIVLLSVGMYFSGGHHVEQIWKDKVKEVEGKLAIAEEKSQQVIIKVETQVVERIKVVKQRVEVIKKEIEIQKEIVNAECKVNDTAVELYNKAISDPAGEEDLAEKGEKSK